MNGIQYRDDWNKIAQLADVNKLSYLFVRNILLSLNEYAFYQVEEYPLLENKALKILQTRSFATQNKQLSIGQLQALDQIVESIVLNPALGKQMQSELKDIQVLEFSLLGKDALFAYQFKSDKVILHTLNIYQWFSRLGNAVLKIALKVL